MNNKIDVNEAADVVGVLPETLMKFVVDRKIDFVSDGEKVLFDKVDIVELREQRRKERNSAFEQLREFDMENNIFE